MGHEAKTVLHLSLFSATTCRASPKWVLPHRAPPLKTVRCQVVFGRPGFLLPGGVQRKATLVIRNWFILSTGPSHRIYLRLISVKAAQYQVTRRRHLKKQTNKWTRTLLYKQKIETPRHLCTKRRGCETYITAKITRPRDPWNSTQILRDPWFLKDHSPPLTLWQPRFC